MIDYELCLITGATLSDIRHAIENIHEIYIGLFISELTYKNEKEGIIKKKEYFEKICHPIRKINHDITKFNQLIKFVDKSFLPIEKIDLKKIKIIIDSHKGDYPRSENFRERFDETIGRGDSATALSVKHLRLQFGNVFLPTQISIKDYFNSLKQFLSPFDCYKKENIRKTTQRDIDKIMAIFSIGGLAESVFLVGRLLEDTITKFLIELIKHKKINLTIKYIKSNECKLDNKIDLLHCKQLTIISESQQAKMKSIKWDRNLYGHSGKVSPKDASAMVIIGLQNIEYLDKKIISLLK